MGLDADNAAPMTAPEVHHDAEPATVPAKRSRAPLDPDARAAASERAKLRRLLSKAKDAKNLDEFFSRIDELRGREPAKREAEAAPVQVVEVQPARNAWEDPRALAEVQPKLEGVWLRVLGAMPDRYRPKPSTVHIDHLVDESGEVRTMKVEANPAADLARGTAPLAVKLGAKAATSPEALAAVSVGLTLGPALASMFWGEVVKPWLAKRKARASESATTGAIAE